ncbi:hypothetical protein [Streptomyces sp. NPDC006784]|uniref:hypothetical protein n=1 Tax=Streptomyces sp. NPDC006784 TaxID=3364764 RepID=UPI0036B1AA4E
MPKSPKMTAKRRRSLPKRSFAIPGKRAYPIDTKPRARNALARVAQHGTPAQRAKVRAAVRRKYPSIAVGGKGRR